MRQRILLDFGTRPEVIKLAPLIKALERVSSFEPKVCITGQHRQMLDQTLKLFVITPDFDLNVLQTAHGLGSITTAALSGLDNIFDQFAPDAVLMRGNTTTTMAATLAAFYRRITDILASRYFAPAGQAQQNLLGEGVDTAYNVGIPTTTIRSFI